MQTQEHSGIGCGETKEGEVKMTSRFLAGVTQSSAQDIKGEKQNLWKHIPSGLQTFETCVGYPGNDDPIIELDLYSWSCKKKLACY